MPTYVYETIPEVAGEAPQQFEIKQSMKDAPLSQHPTSGRRVRRVIRGGFGINTRSWTKAAPAPSRTGTSTGAGSCCGVSGCCPH